LLPLALIMQFSWLGLVYGGLTAGLLVWSTGRLYNGEKDARVVAEALALLQGVVAFVCTILLAYTPAADRITHHVAQPVLWMALPPRPTKGLQEALPRLAPWLGQSLLPGVVAVLTGVILLVTAPWAKRVQNEGTDKAYVAGLLGALTSLFRWQLLLTVLGTLA